MLEQLVGEKLFILLPLLNNSAEKPFHLLQRPLILIEKDIRCNIDNFFFRLQSIGGFGIDKLSTIHAANIITHVHVQIPKKTFLEIKEVEEEYWQKETKVSSSPQVGQFELFCQKNCIS